MTVIGTGIPTGATISAIGAGQITLNVNATADGTATSLTFLPYDPANPPTITFRLKDDGLTGVNAVGSDTEAGTTSSRSPSTPPRTTLPTELRIPGRSIESSTYTFKAGAPNVPDANNVYPFDFPFSDVDGNNLKAVIITGQTAVGRLVYGGITGNLSTGSAATITNLSLNGNAIAIGANSSISGPASRRAQPSCR